MGTLVRNHLSQTSRIILRGSNVIERPENGSIEETPDGCYLC